MEKEKENDAFGKGLQLSVHKLNPLCYDLGVRYPEGFDYTDRFLFALVKVIQENRYKISEENLNTAEEVKMKIGSVYPLEKEMTMDVKGRDQVTWLPKTVKITSEEIRSALSDPVKAIIEVIKNTLEETPAELAADLVDRGIIMSGGGSLIKGLPELLAQETELPVNLADDPITCVARGTGMYLEELDNIKNSKKKNF